MSKITRFRGAAMAALAIAAASSLSACAGDYGAKQIGGGLLGGAGGAALGAQFGKGNGQLATTAIGAVVGAFAGSEAGKSLDRSDTLWQQQGQQRYAQPPQYYQAPPVQYVQPAPAPMYQPAPTMYQPAPLPAPQYTAPQQYGGYSPQMPPSGVNIQACGGTTGIPCMQQGATSYGRR